MVELDQITDYHLLTGIFGDRDLNKVHNPCLFRLNKKCLRYSFTILHCPTKCHKGADAISCNSVLTVEALISICTTHPSSKYIHLSNNIDAAMELATIQATMNMDDNNAAMTPDHIQVLGQNDQS